MPWFNVSWRRTKFIGVLIFIAYQMWMPALALAENEGEATIKAAFIFNFFKYIEWPAEVVDRDTLVLCANGSSNSIINDKLEELNNKQINARRLVVRKNVPLSSLSSCNMVFLSDANDQSATLAKLQSAPVVTVSDGSNFINQGGLIAFVADDNRLTFHVNQDLAQSLRIRINAQLLKLAKFVKLSAKPNTP